MSERPIETLEDFKAACERHDLTYAYSDDGECWRRGCRSHDRIREAPKKFPTEDVKRIWDAVVDQKLIEGARDNFFWRD